MPNVSEHISVSNSGYSLPVEDLLTGRGAVFGKSGSGKSNTATVIAEELLTEGLPMMIVDQDGEYYGLRDEFDMLHVGADDRCDRIIGTEDAEHVADIALEDNTPVILDVSGYVEEEVAHEIVETVIRRLFQRENDLMKPFLLLVEEIHEYIPEKGGHDDLGDMIIRVAKRGRKRGLGICGISQRPASVSKDFITQCDWIVWHRLTWDNDTKVVGRILGSEYSDRVTELRDGEAYVMTDWDEDVRRIRFRLKRTAGGGGTPGLENLTDVGSTASGGTTAPDPPPDAGTTAVEPVEPEQAELPADAEEADPPDADAADASAEAPPDDKPEHAEPDPRKALEEAREQSRNGSESMETDSVARPNAPRRIESHEGNILWEFSQMMLYLLSLMAYNLGRAIHYLLSGLGSVLGGIASLPAALLSRDTSDASGGSANASGQRPDPLASPNGPEDWEDDPRNDALADQDDPRLDAASAEVPVDGPAREGSEQASREDAQGRSAGVDDDRVTEILETHGRSSPPQHGEAREHPDPGGFDHSESERFATTGHLNWVRFAMVLVVIIVLLLGALGYVLFVG